MEITASGAAGEPRPTPTLWPALVGLFFFAFTFRSSSGAYLVGMITLLVWLARAQRPPVPALPTPLLKVSAAYLAALGAHMLWTLWLGEYSLWETLEGYRHYAELLLFIPFSVVIYHCRAHWRALLWIPVLAVVVRVLHRTDFSSLETTLFYKWIYGFGQHHVTFGMQAMLAIVAIAALTLGTAAAVRGARRQWAVRLGAMAAAALLLQALITSGSRSGWGCLLVGLTALLYCSRRQIFSALRSPRGATAATVLLLVAAALVAQNFEKIERRVARDTQVNFNFTLSVDELPRDRDVFFARRIHLAHFGLVQWRERPWLGHGPASVRPMLAADPDFHVHPHLHNTYIQVLMELGVLMTSVLALLIATLTFYLWRARPGWQDELRPMYNLIAASAISVVVWSLAAFHLHSSDWRFVFAWYTAFAAFLIRERAGRARESADSPGTTNAETDS